MSFHEEMKFFLDQSDSNPETGIVYGSGTPEHKEHWKKKEISEAETVADKLESQIKDSINLIDSVELDLAIVNDPEQKNLLQNKKETAKKMIRTVLDDVADYTSIKKRMDYVREKGDREDSEKWREENHRMEDMRKIKHDALVTDLISLIRFVSHNFGKISEKAIEKWEEEQEEKGVPILHIKRIKFPDKIICPNSVDLRDRTSIGKWAIELGYALEKIKKDPGINDTN